MQELEKGRIHAALDVWPGEPELDPRLLRHTVIATPHVAGYSVQGKQNGTLMIYQAFCDWIGVLAGSAGTRPATRAHCTLDDDEDVINRVLESVCGVTTDDHAMRAAFPGPLNSPAEGFDLLRRNYRLRNDFAAWTISGASGAQAVLLEGLGFNLA
jgi:erythronate-4-phosphate dehydrogenase